LADKPDYSGMTVNERLFQAGLLKDWDLAAVARDRDRMIAILAQVDAEAATAAAVLAGPAARGS
jgi:hypothetical protein